MRACAPLLALALAACASAAPAPRPRAEAPPPAEQRFAADEPAYVFADPARLAKLRSAFPALDALGAAELARQRLPSLTLGVVIDGELAYARGFGFADLAKKVPADADTVYRIGSITKSLTGLTLLALRDDGALSLDEPLTRLLPEAAGLVYPTRDAAPLTLRQLLTHTSGLPRTGSYPLHEGPSEQAVVRSLAGFALATPPGTAHTYSNLGYGLLGIAASRAAHAPYRDLVKKRLLAPLAMISATFDATDVPQGRLAMAYKLDAGGPAAVPPWRLGAAEGAGGLFASTRDLARWVAFQLSAYPPRGGPDAGPVRRSTVRESHATGAASGLYVRLEPSAKKGEKVVEAFADTYGFGWISETTCDFDPLVTHGGGTEGFSADVRFLPKHGVGVVVLVNLADARASGVASRALDALAKTGGLAPRVPTLAPAFAPAVQRLLGVLGAWDDQAYAAMLTKDRPPFPKEKEELAAYRRRHGACKAWRPLEVTHPTRAKLAVECERGKLELTVRLGPDGLIAGFDGTSLDVEIPPEERAAAEAIVKLVAKWDDALYEKHLAKAFTDKAEVRGLYDGLRARHGTCAVESATHGAFERSIRLGCERGGDINLKLTLDEKDPAVVRGYWLRPAGGAGVCPVR